jgi:hypothetical protein
MSKDHIGVLDKGGRVLLVGLRGANLSNEWQDDPRVIVWDGDKEAHKDVPTNVKAIIYTRFLDHAVTNALTKVARNRRLVIFPMLHTHQVKEKLALLGIGAVKEATREVVSPKQVEAAKRGQTRELVLEHVDFAKVSSDEARRVLKIAEDRGIKTTMPALLQQIVKLRREKGLTGTVGSVQPKKTREMQLLAVLEDGILNLTLLRDAVKELEAENRELRERQDAMAKVLGKT